MKLTLEESDLKPEYKDSKTAQEDASFEMFNDKAQEAMSLVPSATFVSNDAKVQRAVYPPRS